MLLIRPDWLPKNEFILSYEANSRGFEGYKTQQANGDIHYYRKVKAKYARTATYVKVRTISRETIERAKLARAAETF